MSRNFRTVFGSITNKGVQPNNNQDYLLVSEELRLAIVCDGVSGVPGGEIASKLAANCFRDYVDQELKAKAPMKTTQDVKNILRNAVLFSSRTVFEFGQKESRYRGLSTTLDAVFILTDRIFTVHVGDGSIFQLQDNNLECLTVEHNFKNYLMKTGKYSKDAAHQSPFAKVLERAVGHHPVVNADIECYQIDHNDIFLICTDGITKAIALPEIEHEVKASVNSLLGLPKKLIDINNSRGGKDNATVVVVSVQEMGSNSNVLTKQAFSRFQKESAVRQVDFFAKLNRNNILKLLSIGKLKQFSKETFLVLEGESPKHFWILLTGEVSVYSKKHNDGKLPKSKSGPGECIGEGAIFSKAGRNASVVATQDTQALEFDGIEFNSLTNEDSEFGAQVFQSIGSILYDRLSAENKKN